MSEEQRSIDEQLRKGLHTLDGLLLLLGVELVNPNIPFADLYISEYVNEHNNFYSFTKEKQVRTSEEHL